MFDFSTAYKCRCTRKGPKIRYKDVQKLEIKPKHPYCQEKMILWVRLLFSVSYFLLLYISLACPCLPFYNWPLTSFFCPAFVCFSLLFLRLCLEVGKKSVLHNIVIFCMTVLYWFIDTKYLHFFTQILTKCWKYKFNFWGNRIYKNPLIFQTTRWRWWGNKTYLKN